MKDVTPEKLRGGKYEFWQTEEKDYRAGMLITVHYRNVPVDTVLVFDNKGLVLDTSCKEHNDAMDRYFQVLRESNPDTVNK